MKHFVATLAKTDDCVLNMCVSVYTSYPLESVMIAGGRGVVLGGLRLTLQGLQGYSASALHQILKLSHSLRKLLTGQSVRLVKKSAGVAISCLSVWVR